MEVSASVMTQMNMAADPCDDFYEYACGDFSRNPLNPRDEAKYSQFSIVARRNRALVHMVQISLTLNSSEIYIYFNQIFVAAFEGNNQHFSELNICGESEVVL